MSVEVKIQRVWEDTKILISITKEGKDTWSGEGIQREHIFLSNEEFALLLSDEGLVRADDRISLVWRVSMPKCACCNRPTDDSYRSPDGYIFCSTECAVYAGRVSIRDGWINTGEAIKQSPPKQMWWLDSDNYEYYIKQFGWSWNGENWVLSNEQP